MKYTVLLTEKSDGGIHVSIPALPECAVEADSREEAIHLAREAIAGVMRHTEIVHVEVPQPHRGTTADGGTPWEWFGSATGDPTWGALFDDIEHRREATRKGR